MIKNKLLIKNNNELWIEIQSIKGKILLSYCIGKFDLNNITDHFESYNKVLETESYKEMVQYRNKYNELLADHNQLILFKKKLETGKIDLEARIDEVLELPIRVLNVLWTNQIKTLKDLFNIKYDKRFYTRLPNFGKKSLEDLKTGFFEYFGVEMFTTGINRILEERK